MNILKITPDQTKLFETLGITHILGSRKAIYVPFVLMQVDQAMPDEFQLIPVGREAMQEWENFKRLYDADITIS